MKPRVKTEHCRTLWRLLSDGQWHQKRNIPMNGRMIRAVCAEKPEHFLSSQKGYKLVKYATDEELDIAIADLRSRIRHLDDRAGALELVQSQRCQVELDYEQSAPQRPVNVFSDSGWNRCGY